MSEDSRREGVGGLLLTGGSSRRMGFDKARMLVDGIASAVRVARALDSVCGRVLEVGPGVSGVSAVIESPHGEGPLAALVCGARALQAEGRLGQVVVVACDLPFLRPAGLREIARWPVEGSVVPVVDGKPQPLCARWSGSDLALAASLLASGERSLRALVEATRPTFVDVKKEAKALTVDQLEDLDTLVDAARHGVDLRPGADAPVGLSGHGVASVRSGE
ncbi:MAG: NTP transferase domain-containing protein [Acidimicrobiales bacterium]